MGSFVINVQPPPVQAQKYVSRKEGDSLVFIDEWMVDDQRFEQRGGHLGKVGIVAGLRAMECALEQAPVSKTRLPAEDLDQVFVHCQDFVGR